ncbi:MAG: hypothetical protein AAFV43_01405 [Planctomycetota bacterium]
MDSEHRHELEENVLAKWLEEKVETIKPQLPVIVTVLIAAVAGTVGWSAYQRSAEDATGGQWRSFTLAMEGQNPSLDALKQTALDYPDTGVAEWADITWADGRLWEASNQYLRDRTSALELVAEAKATYETLERASNPEVADRASYGLARALELEGDFAAAAEQYGRVGGPFALLAERRAEDLQDDEAKTEYGWLTSIASEPQTGDITRPGAEPDDIPMPPSDPLADEDDEGGIDSLLEQFAPIDDALSDDEPTDDDAVDDQPMADDTAETTATGEAAAESDTPVDAEE